MEFGFVYRPPDVPMFDNPNTKASFLSTLIYFLQIKGIKKILREQPTGEPIKEGEQHMDLNMDKDEHKFYLALQKFHKNIKMPNDINEKFSELPELLADIILELYRKRGMGNLYNIQNIEEHLGKFIEYMHEALSYPIKQKVTGKQRDGEAGNIDRFHLMYYRHRYHFWGEAYSQITDNINLTLVSSITCCDCMIHSPSFSAEEIVSLYVDDNNDTTTLEASLHRYMEP